MRRERERLGEASEGGVKAFRREGECRVPFA